MSFDLWRYCMSRDWCCRSREMGMNKLESLEGGMEEGSLWRVIEFRCGLLIPSSKSDLKLRSCEVITLRTVFNYKALILVQVPHGIMKASLSAYVFHLRPFSTSPYRSIFQLHMPCSGTKIDGVERLENVRGDHERVDWHYFLQIRYQ